MKKSIKRYAALVIIVLTTAAFIYYFLKHPEYWQQLKHVSIWTIIWIIFLNTLMIAVLTIMTQATIVLCGKRLGWKENFLLTSYSSLANFFGPLQSGPGVRAVYLKTKHKIRLRDYTLASLIALGMFAFFSALFLLVGTRPWWQTAITLIAVGGFSYVVINKFKKRDKSTGESQFSLRAGPLSVLLIMSFLQVVLTVGWYYAELHAVYPQIHLSQAMSYAGAANFALFVSITPDAIGIREAFLVFSQHIHHVPTAAILSANVIDRVSYVVFLGFLFLLVIGLHAQQYLNVKKLRQAAAEESGQ